MKETQTLSVFKCSRQFLIIKFYNMLNDILNLEGVSLLNKEEQGTIQGGLGGCVITVTGPGSTGGGVVITDDGEQAETAGAHAACAFELENNPPGTRCFYDCSFDGPG